LGHGDEDAASKRMNAELRRILALLLERRLTTLACRTTSSSLAASAGRLQHLADERDHLGQRRRARSRTDTAIEPAPRAARSTSAVRLILAAPASCCVAAWSWCRGRPSRPSKPRRRRLAAAAWRRRRGAARSARCTLLAAGLLRQERATRRPPGQLDRNTVRASRLSRRGRRTPRRWSAADGLMRRHQRLDVDGWAAPARASGAAVGTNSPSVRLVELQVRQSRRAARPPTVIVLQAIAVREQEPPVADRPPTPTARSPPGLESAKPSANAFSALAR
jgi:hypothetical protein